MKRKLLIAIIFIFTLTVSASDKFTIKEINFNKEEQVINKLPKENSLTYKIDFQDENQDIIDLSKKITYLLLGPGNKSETSEDYYKRHKDYLNMRYKPEIPTKNGQVDTNSQEYKDDLVSSFAVSTIFTTINELDVNYSTFGDINVSKSNDLILSTVILPSVTMKSEDNLNPTKYNRVNTNLVIYYFFKKNNNDYQLFYLVVDNKDNIDEYLNYINEHGNKNTINIAKDYSGTLNNLYNITNLKKINNYTLTNMYENNKNKISKIISFYKDGSSFIGNGFFINKGIIVTTWDYLKKALINSEDIKVIFNNQSYDVDGIVTVNKDSNIAVLKLTEEISSGVKLATKKSIEDPVIAISNQVIGYKANKGLLVTDNGYLQSTIPVSTSDEGSPLFNINGEVVGMNTATLANSPSSFAIPYMALSEIQNKFANTSFKDIKVVSFKELKKDYYVTYGQEETNDDISKSRWKKIDNITEITNHIHMKIVKASYSNGVVSIRYKNNLNDTIRPMKMAESFKNFLLNNGFKEELYSDKKCIYVKGDYQVILMEEFDYLIVVMVI